LTFHPVLQKILDEKKRELRFIQKYTKFPPTPPSFSESLKKQKISIIAECKKGSPSAGVLRAEYDPKAIAKDYEAMGAGAISVLTDQNFFMGHIDHLKLVSDAVKIPVLRKDFIIDKLQIQEARYFGASAILLIARILTPSKLEELLDYAHSLQLEALVEIHTHEEAKMALGAGAKIIGINTRDLDTFQILPNVVAEISPSLPTSIHRVGESGIQTSDDLKNMLKFADSVLVGTYFMKSGDIRTAYKELLASVEG
jgi:indole-3-glycerol phosphate synthase